VKILLISILIVFMAYPLFSQEVDQKNDWELSTGISMMLYQSVYSFQQSAAFETAIRKNLTKHFDVQVGTRLSFEPVLSDIFGRLLVAPELGRWRPFVGVECGYSNRAHFEAGEKLLREARSSMEGGISHVYIAGHSAPLSFQIKGKWRLSFMEIHIGTHLGNTGQTLRVQIGIISLGRKI
jgi:hypothetical protein